MAVRVREEVGEEWLFEGNGEVRKMKEPEEREKWWAEGVRRRERLVLRSFGEKAMRSGVGREAIDVGPFGCLFVFHSGIRSCGLDSIQSPENSFAGP